MRIGLTGGIGCGKSTAGQIFQDLGFLRIDCDEVVKREVLTDASVLRQLRDRFGPNVFFADGTLDRARLAERVFASPSELRWLEAVVHPEVSRRWKGRMQEAPDKRWLVEIPLLFEKELQKEFDLVVCVACSPDVQLARLEQRGMTRSQAEQRMAQQLPLARKIELSDCVLSNDGTPDFLREQITRFVGRL